ncbi:hypothetical protein Bca4012_065379 [Brassica carinata]
MRQEGLRERQQRPNRVWMYDQQHSSTTTTTSSSPLSLSCAISSYEFRCLLPLQAQLPSLLLRLHRLCRSFIAVSPSGFTFSPLSLLPIVGVKNGYLEIDF